MTAHAVTPDLDQNALDEHVLELPARLRLAPDLPVCRPTPGLELELEWCEDCSPEDGPFDEQAAPGAPALVVESRYESAELPVPQWDPGFGRGPEHAEHEITALACGHQIVRAV